MNKICPLSLLPGNPHRSCPEKDCALWHSCNEMCSVKDVLVCIAAFFVAARSCAEAAEEWLKEHKDR